MIHGFVMTPAAHCVLESGGGQEAQQACMVHAAVHYKRDKKWLTTVTSFVIAVKKQLQPSWKADFSARAHPRCLSQAAPSLTA